MIGTSAESVVELSAVLQLRTTGDRGVRVNAAPSEPFLRFGIANPTIELKCGRDSRTITGNYFLENNSNGSFQFFDRTGLDD